MDNKIVLQLALTFKNQLKKYGRDFKFSKSNDITKTYQFRWFKSFINKCLKKKLNINDCHEVIKCLVEYANDNKLLNAGVALVGRNDVIEIACKKFESDLKTNEMIIEDISKIMPVVTDNFSDFLVKKVDRNGYSNLYMMYHSGKINKTFMSLSRSCMNALSRVGNERKEFPPLIEFVKIKMNVIDRVGIDRLKEIMGNEFNG